MEYSPRHPQPFSLAQAIALDPAVASDEIARLSNSLDHLRRTQDDLHEHLRGLAPEADDGEVSQAVKENEITIASQDERIFMLKLALAHHAHSAASGTPTATERLALGSSSNGLDDPSPPQRTAAAASQTEAHENGVYL